MKILIQSATITFRFFSICGVFLLLAFPALAQLDTAGDTLRGLPGVIGAVGGTMSPATGDIMDNVKFLERINDGVDKELRQYGVYSESDKAAGLDIHLAEAGGSGRDGQSSGFIISLEVQQAVHLLRNPSATVNAATYSLTAFVPGGVNNLGGVEDQTYYLLAEFLQIFMAVNGRSGQTVTIPTSEAAHLNQQVAAFITHTLSERFTHPQRPEPGYHPSPPEPDSGLDNVPLPVLVTVDTNGVATLHGTLDRTQYPEIKDDVEDIASRWPGVTGVRNFIHVTGPPPPLKPASKTVPCPPLVRRSRGK